MDQPHEFFAEISSKIEVASILSAEFNRKLAHQFNIFAYLRTDELGLSRLIADILNPNAKHGQGTLFLKEFLRLTGFGQELHNQELDQIYVETEHKTGNKNRRIDILVKIIHNDQQFILAFENKPYAEDSENQVLDYLVYLNSLKPTAFQLVYLSGYGNEPSEFSLPPSQRKRWLEKLVVMTYAGYQDNDHIQDDYKSTDSTNNEEIEFRFVTPSLADWFKSCREKCDVDKLRWILADAESYCRKTFQSVDSTPNEEVIAVKEFLLKNRKYIDSAYMVHKTWQSVADELCREFLDLLVKKIENELKTKCNDLCIERSYEFFNTNAGLKVKANAGLKVYRESWQKFRNDDSSTGERSFIGLLSDETKRPDKWYVGVSSPCQIKTLNDEVRKALSNPEDYTSLSSWGTYRYVKEEYRNWESILASKLVEEIENDTGEDEVSKFYIDEFCDFVGNVLPILDELDRDYDLKKELVNS